MLTFFSSLRNELIRISVSFFSSTTDAAVLAWTFFSAVMSSLEACREAFSGGS